MARARPEVSVWPFVGMAGMACAFFLYAASAAFAPWWLVALLLALWVVLLLVACVSWTPHPRRVVGAAVVALLVWVGVVALLSAG